MRALLAGLATVVPWIPAAPPPTPHPPLAPACRMAQLRVHERREAGAAGSLVGAVIVRNAGSACSLLGRPRLTAMLRGRRITATPPGPGGLVTERLPPDAVPPTYSLRAMPTGSSALFTYQWSNWCGSRRPLLTASFAGGRVAFHAEPPACDSTPDVPPVLEVGRFIQSIPSPPPASELPFTVGFPRLNYAAHAGGMLRYRITLRNASKRPFTFRTCPVYEEALTVRGNAGELHVLNCAPARTFAPGQARVFEMQMRVPRGTRGERSPIFFTLGVGTWNAPIPPIGREAVVTIS